MRNRTELIFHVAMDKGKIDYSIGWRKIINLGSGLIN